MCNKPSKFEKRRDLNTFKTTTMQQIQTKTALEVSSYFWLNSCRLSADTNNRFNSETNDFRKVTTNGIPIENSKNKANILFNNN